MEVRLFRPTTRNTQLVGVRFARQYRDWLELYFSYETIVAFQESGHKIVVCYNMWSNTTGRHLNEIDDGAKKDRLQPNAFQEQLDATLRCFFDE